MNNNYWRQRQFYINDPCHAVIALKQFTPLDGTLPVFVVKGDTAKDFLKTSYSLENVPAVGALKEYNQTGGLKEASFLNFLMSAMSEGSSANLPTIEIGSNPFSKNDQEQEEGKGVNKKGFRISGTGIFNKDLKLIGFLNVDETKVLRWVDGSLEEQTITAVVPQEKGNVSLSVIKMGRKIQPIIQGNKVKILVTLTGKGMIRENNTNLDLSQSKNIRLIQNALDNQVQKSVLQTISKVQKEYGADVFGFSNTIHRKYPYRWNSLKKKWDKEFSKAEISVKANLIVRQVGLTGPPVQLREGEIKE